MTITGPLASGHRRDLRQGATHVEDGQFIALYGQEFSTDLVDWLDQNRVPSLKE